MTTRQIAFLKLFALILAALLFMGTTCDDGSEWETRPQSAPTADAAEHQRRRDLFKAELGLDQSGNYPTPQVNFTHPITPIPMESRIVK